MTTMSNRQAAKQRLQAMELDAKASTVSWLWYGAAAAVVIPVTVLACWVVFLWKSAGATSC